MSADKPSTGELPRPDDEGAAAHLPGRQVPAIALPSTTGNAIALAELSGRTVVFVYPDIGGPGEELLEDWTALPGARGCTPEACGFRDLLGTFGDRDVRVLGLSSQALSEQVEAVEHLGLPYPMLSDEQFELTQALTLPTFEFHGANYLRRVTLVIAEGKVEAALYPVFPPDEGAEQALAWLDRT